FVHFRRGPELAALLQEAQRRENDFLGVTTHLLDGFKEMRMSRARNTDLFQHLRGISAGVQEVKGRAGTRFTSHYVFTQAMIYGLLAAIVFLLPRVSPEYTDVVPKLTAALLFIIGPLGGIVGSIPL